MRKGANDFYLLGLGAGERAGEGAERRLGGLPAGPVNVYICVCMYVNIYIYIYIYNRERYIYRYRYRYSVDRTGQFLSLRLAVLPVADADLGLPLASSFPRVGTQTSVSAIRGCVLSAPRGRGRKAAWT